MARAGRGLHYYQGRAKHLSKADHRRRARSIHSKFLGSSQSDSRLPREHLQGRNLPTHRVCQREFRRRAPTKRDGEPIAAAPISLLGPRSRRKSITTRPTCSPWRSGSIPSTTRRCRLFSTSCSTSMRDSAISASTVHSSMDRTSSCPERNTSTTVRDPFKAIQDSVGPLVARLSQSLIPERTH